MLALASITREDVANYVSALFEVYIALILLYVLANLVFALGGRPPYARWFDVLMRFLRDICEPYLRLFRRFIPVVGSIDLSPTVALIVLIVLDPIVHSLIAG